MIDEIKIVDNFLPNDEFFTFKNIMLAEEFPWYYSGYKHNSFIFSDNKNYDYNFTHFFFKDHNKLSKYYDILFPILRILRPYAIFRIKANLTLHYNEVVTHGFHTDIEDTYKNIDTFKTAIFYVNNSDGKTLFKNGQELDTSELIVEKVVEDFNLEDDE